MTELADVLDLESSVFGRESSTLSSRTSTKKKEMKMDYRTILSYGISIFFVFGGVALIVFAIRAKHDPSRIGRG